MINNRNSIMFEEGKPHKSWKNEVNILMRVTDLEEKKEGSSFVTVALSGRAQGTVMEILDDEINE